MRRIMLPPACWQAYFDGYRSVVMGGSASIPAWIVRDDDVRLYAAGARQARLDTSWQMPPHPPHWVFLALGTILGLVIFIATH